MAAITADHESLLWGISQHDEQIWHCNPLQHVSYPLLNGTSVCVIVCMCVSLTVYTCTCMCDVIVYMWCHPLPPSFPQHRMDLMLCRCRMWAPPTWLCLGTCQLTVMASSSTSVCIAMVLWRVSCPLLWSATTPPASSPSLCTCTCMSSLLLCATCANNSVHGTCIWSVLSTLSVGQVLQSRPQALHSSWNGRHQCCSQPAQVHCVQCTLQSLSLCSIFLCSYPSLSSFLSFSPVPPSLPLPPPSLPPPSLPPPSLPLPPPPLSPSLPPSLTPSLLSSCINVHVYQQGHLWQNYTYHLSSLYWLVGVMNVWGSMLH